MGIVTEVSGGSITVIEGNMSDAVGYRHLSVNGRYIRGYGVPNYASKATSGSTKPGKTEAPAETVSGSADAHKVGDVVEFTGTQHYVSASASTGSSCKPGKAKVTQVYQVGKAKHPYHLIAVNGGGSTVYGWVNAADIAAASSARTHTVVRGDTLWGIAAAYLGDGSRYTEIMQKNGLRSVIIKIGQELQIPAK